MTNKTNPMIFASDSLAMSAQCTNSVFFSTPTTVLEVVWAGLSASCSLTLFDMDYNQVIHHQSNGSVATEVITNNPKLFANGLRTSTSTNIEDGQVFIWVR